MRTYILRRLVLLIPTLFLLGTLLFFLLRALPGDATDALAAIEEVSRTPEQLEAQRELFGLNDPLLQQYGRWMWQALRGDLGFSIIQDKQVLATLATKIEVTASLALLAIFLSLGMAIPAGILSALWRGSWLDQAIRLVTAAGMAVPSFWLGIMVIVLLALWLNWIPPIDHASVFEDPQAAFSRLIFPALVIAGRTGAVITRLMRSTMLEIISEDYIRTARAKGLAEATVIMRHALKNTLPPVLTIAALMVAELLNGAVLLENIFALPGLGAQIVNSIHFRDFIMVQGIVMILAVGMLVWILVIDLIYAWLDPRIRYD